MKSVKKLLGVFVLVAFVLFLVPNNVDAKEINSAQTLKEAFDGYSATVEGTTVTLTGNIDFTGSDDVFEVDEEDYVFNLNGYSIKLSEFYLNSGSLIVNDTTGSGKVDAIFTMFGEETTVVVNNGSFGSLIDNYANFTINDGNFHTIWHNGGTLTINDGNFANISNDSAKLFIKGGTFTAYRLNDSEGPVDYFSMFNVNSETVITGGTFTTNDYNTALQLYGNNEFEVEENSIDKLVGKGYLAETVINQSTSWDISYRSVEIVSDGTEEILNKIAPNGVITLNVEKPDDDDKAYFFLSEVVRNMAKTDKYYIEIAFPSEGDFDPENGVISFHKPNGQWLYDKKIKVAYKESDKSASAKVAPIVKKIVEKTKGETNIENSFLLEDLHLINYLKSLKDGINSEMSLNFSKELIELTNGSNIAYKFDTRMGSSSAGLWFYLGGWGFVYYNGEPIDGAKIGITRSHVLYVPSDTKDTDEARIEAALKRIKDYLGTTDGIKIEVGGTLESTGSEEYNWNYYDLIDEKTSGKNYYNVTINGKVYKFAICKKDTKELENPKYIASDLMSNISIKSDSSELPLDTAITVKSVTSDKIEKALGTNVYTAYDISLYSNAKQGNISKLENGKFVVNIPVPENLKGKEITVYYINSEGKKEEHIANVKDGIASFETNHFSTYVLTEKLEEENPKTFDGITTSILIVVISLIGLITAAIYLKKEIK